LAAGGCCCFTGEEEPHLRPLAITSRGVAVSRVGVVWDMFAEMGLLFPHLQVDLQEVDHHGRLPLEEELFCRLQSSDGLFLPRSSATSFLCLLSSTILNFTKVNRRKERPSDYSTLCFYSFFQNNLMHTTIISDYDLGAEGDLFRAPEPIMEESLMELDYISAAMSMMCHGDTVTCTEAFDVAGADPAQDQQLFVDDLYGSKNDLTWAKPTVEELYSDLLDVKLPSPQMVGENVLHNDSFVAEESTQKSLGSGCLQLEPLDQMSGGFVRPAELFDFQGLDLGDVFGIRQGYGDGDIQAVANGHMNHFSATPAHLPFERLLTIGEERRQKLSRYRKKRTKRNFGRKIKYACRKALADSQPRVRGRFAKTEEFDPSKPSK
ncbi:hypothetical protein Taro_050846, partial [Colocasia esculenta]|nr:hypothetical protein [Colocasia esculenta]